MNILEALHSEEGKLHRQLSAIRGAIAALNGSAKPAVQIYSQKHTNGRRQMSAATRAKISRRAKARWARIRAGQSKGKATG